MTDQILAIIATNLRRLADDLERYGQTGQLPERRAARANNPNGHNQYHHAPSNGTAEDLARNAPSKPETKLMKVAEVSKELQLSNARVYQMIANGELPSISFGKSRRVVRAELSEWLARGGQR